MGKFNRRSFVAVATAAVLSAVAVPSFAQPKPDATIEFQVTKAGFIVGGTGGSGTLTYKGKKYPLTIAGVSLGATVGVSKADMVGEVYNLKDVNDINGMYESPGAGYAAGGGQKVADLRNSKGVNIKARGKQTGAMLEADLSGLKIELKK